MGLAQPIADVGQYPMPWKLKKFDLAWSGIWRSGFTFVTIDQFGQIVSGPGQFDFPISLR